MKVKLSTGEIAEMKKDCECLDAVHLGMHFLYEDEVSKTNNLKIIELITESNPVESFCLMCRYLECEVVRLGRLYRSMERHGIEELVLATNSDQHRGGST